MTKPTTSAKTTKPTRTRTRRPWAASIFTRKDRPGTLWAKWKDSTGATCVRNTGTADRVAAERCLAVWTAPVVADVERGVRSVTVRDFALSEYLPVLRARVVEAHADNVAAHVLGFLPDEKGLDAATKRARARETAAERDARRRGGFGAFIGSVPMHEIGTDKVELYLARIRTGAGAVSPATVARIAASLSGLFRAAVDANAAKVNPVVRAKLPKVQQFEPVTLTPADVDRIIAHAPESARPAFTLLADLGLRLGELLRLTWQHVAEDDSQIVVASSKSGRTRAIPVPARSRALLATMRKARVVPLRGTDFVAAGPRAGRPWSHSRLQRLFRDAARAAGLPVTPDADVGVRIHDLRHAYASALARNGVPLSVVAALIGDSLQVTSSRYARHVPASAAVLAVASLDRPASTAQAAKAGKSKEQRSA